MAYNEKAVDALNKKVADSLKQLESVLKTYVQSRKELSREASGTINLEMIKREIKSELGSIVDKS